MHWHSPHTHQSFSTCWKTHTCIHTYIVSQLCKETIKEVTVSYFYVQVTQKGHFWGEPSDVSPPKGYGVWLDHLENSIQRIIIFLYGLWIQILSRNLTQHDSSYQLLVITTGLMSAQLAEGSHFDSPVKNKKITKLLTAQLPQHQETLLLHKSQ